MNEMTKVFERFCTDLYAGNVRTGQGAESTSLVGEVSTVIKARWKRHPRGRKIEWLKTTV